MTMTTFSFMAPSLWNSLPATLRNVPTLSQFKIAAKNLLVCPGLPVESEEGAGKRRSECVADADLGDTPQRQATPQTS